MGGAAKTVRECARKEYVEKKKYPQKELLSDLRLLHAAVIEDLDKELLKAVCPKGWMLDHTEHACCEKRRLDDAQVRAKEGKNPKRTRDAEAATEDSLPTPSLWPPWPGVLARARLPGVAQ